MDDKAKVIVGCTTETDALEATVCRIWNLPIVVERERSSPSSIDIDGLERGRWIGVGFLREEIVGSLSRDLIVQKVAGGIWSATLLLALSLKSLQPSRSKSEAKISKSGSVERGIPPLQDLYP